MIESETFGDYLPVYQLALPYLDTRDNDVHVQVSFAFAATLVTAYPEADERVVLPAIILHDIGWKTIPEDLQNSAFGPKMTRPDLRRQHEVEGARIAGELLDGLGGFADVRAEIVKIIDGHDTRLDSLSLNDELVKDADKLWRFTETGIAIDIARFEIAWPEYVDWIGECIDDWMFTGEGRHLARLTLEQSRQAGAPTG